MTGRPVGRRRSRLRDLPLIGWLAAAVLIAVAHRWLPDANWLMLHLVLLGALTHAIVVWSFHFAQTLLRAPASEAEATGHNRRLGLLTLGAAAVLIGVPTTWWPLTLAGGAGRRRGRLARSRAVGHAAPRAAGPVPVARGRMSATTWARRHRCSASLSGCCWRWGRLRRACAGERAGLGRADPDRHPAHAVADHAADPMDDVAER